MSGEGNKWTTDSVRQAFIDFFARKEHTFVPSSPVVPHDDPTLLFTNAGMNQFKEIFLGIVDPQTEAATWKRAANSQKCIRAGGKHNDLEDVGRDTYHHTFFEMLGSWSFGDYFKEEAIDWCWELLTSVYGLDKDRLYATYFEGNEEFDVPADEAAKKFWMKYLPEEKIIASNMKDNFWEMGATGPCGPCSEVHYDKTPDKSGLKLVNQDDPLVIEIWNLVFMQFLRETEGGALKKLPATHVDTGMGLERIASILMDVPSNYGCDVFTTIFDGIKEVVGIEKSYDDVYGAADVGGFNTAYRVLADHIRTLTFAIVDGAQPSNVGRGYVLRRIIRRAVRMGDDKFGAKDGFFAELVPYVVKAMGEHFVELKDEAKIAKVQDILRREEKQFRRTLQSGNRKFNELIAGKPAGFVIPGYEAAKLYHTYGYPCDLTQVMAEEKGMTVDMDGYEKAMNGAKEISKKKTSEKVDPMVLGADDVGKLEGLCKVTKDGAKYESKVIQSTVAALWLGSDKEERFSRTFACEEGAKIGLLLDETNFYAEQGGQIGDVGTISAEGFTLTVEDTQTYGGFVVHVGVAKGSVSVGTSVECSVDYVRREPVMTNHTSTHVCNFALREVLGPEIDQEGSKVLAERFRFDFSHTAPLSHEELQKVDSLVQQQIDENRPVFVKEVPLADAYEICSIRAAFGERYPEMVRVVSVGKEVDALMADPGNEDWYQYSVEFCGGTHLPSMGVAKKFCTVSEEAIASGIRRVVCLTGDHALKAEALGQSIADDMEALNSASEGLRATAESKDVVTEEQSASLEGQMAEVRELSKTLKKKVEDKKAVYPLWRKRLFQQQLKTAGEMVASVDKKLKALKAGRLEAFLKDVVDSHDGSKSIIKEMDAGVDARSMKKAITDVQKKLKSVSIVFVSADPTKDKFSLLVSVPKGASLGVSAKDWMAAAMADCGKGGGNATFSQGVGNGASNVADVLSRASAFLEGK